MQRYVIKPMYDRGTPNRQLGPETPPPLPMREPADFTLRMTGKDGKSIDLASYKGKAILVNFWARWCPPSMKELASLAHLRRAVRDDPSIDVLCISTETLLKAETALAKGKLDLPARCIEGKLPAAYESKAIPVTFILSASGEVVFRHVGAARWDDPSVIAFLKKCKA